MAEKSDRERLEKLAQENEQARQEAKASKQRRQADETKRHEELLTQDKEKTEEILRYCKQQFQGFKLVPTGHEVSVDKAGSSRTHGVQVDRVEYVCLNISHWGDETNNFQGLIPLILTRYRNGEYDVIDTDGERTTAKTFDQLKEKLIQLLSGVDRESLQRVFEKVRRHFPGR